MDPAPVLHKLRLLISRLSAQTGIDPFDLKEPLRKPLTWFFITCGVFHLQVIFLTIYKAEDGVNRIHAACSAGFNIQELSIVITMFIYRVELRDQFLDVQSLVRFPYRKGYF